MKWKIYYSDGWLSDTNVSVWNRALSTADEAYELYMDSLQGIDSRTKRFCKFSKYPGPVFNAPGWGVIAIVQTDVDVGREILSGYDYYIFENDKWIGINADGLDDQLLTVGIGRKNIKKGRTMQRSDFKSIYAKAMDDPDFPPKSARLPGERSTD